MSRRRLGVVKKALLLQRAFEAGELCLATACLNRLCAGGEFAQACYLFADAVRVGGERDCGQLAFKLFALFVFQFVKVVRIDVGGRVAGDGGRFVERVF